MALQTFTAGQVLTAAQMTTLQANNGMQLIRSVSFTSQTTVAFANDTFTSTYRNYQVYLECDTDSGAANWTMQLRNNAGAIGGSLYLGGVIGTGISANTVNVGTNNATSFNLASASPDANNIVMTVFNPNTNVRNTTWSGTIINNASFDMGGSFGGIYNAVAAYTGLQFNFSTAVTGTYRVYGLADS